MRRPKGGPPSASPLGDEISPQEANDLIRKFKLKVDYLECSAKTDSGVEKVS